MQKVEAAVKDVFGPLNPREDIQLDRLSALILDVRRKVEGETPEERKYDHPFPFPNTQSAKRNFRTQRWLPYLLPPPSEESTVLRESGTIPSPIPSPPIDPTTFPSPPTSPLPATLPTSSPPLRRLLDETSDLIDSPPFTQVLTLLLDTTFSHLTDQKLRSQAFKIPPMDPSPSPPADTTTRISEITPETDPDTATAKLATILAVMTKQAHAIGSGLPNEYVQAMEGVRELEAFSAVVFSERFEMDVPPVNTPPDQREGLGAVEGPGAAERQGLNNAQPTSEDPTHPEDRTEDNSAPAESITDKAWRSFEGVWGRVVGRKGVDEEVAGAGMTG